MKYNVERTGYYCIDTLPVDNPDLQYSAIAEFRNAYGELPGAQIARLPFYGGLTIVYAVIGIFWGFLYFQNRSDILAVQNYVTATIGFLVFEMLLTWAYYDYLNRHGFNTGAKVLMLIVSVLNAGRNSLSFFLLLIVCMGYGVVKNSLGRTMIWIRWLAAGHFVFGVIYAIGSLTIKPEDAGPLVLLVVLPLAASGTAFYIWTLNSLGATLKDLIARKQHTKAAMYRKLWWCILSSVVVIFLFFFVNVFLFTGQTGDFAPDHWQTRWFELDGWLNLVYLADVAFVAYIWRPTPNNRRFAMSDEVSSCSPFERSLYADDDDDSLPKTTMEGSKLHRFAAPTTWTRRRGLGLQATLRPLERRLMGMASTAPGTAMYLHCRRRNRVVHQQICVSPGKALTARPSLPWVMRTAIAFPTMTVTKKSTRA